MALPSNFGQQRSGLQLGLTGAQPGLYTQWRSNGKDNGQSKETGIVYWFMEIRVDDVVFLSDHGFWWVFSGFPQNRFEFCGHSRSSNLKPLNLKACLKAIGMTCWVPVRVCRFINRGTWYCLADEGNRIISMHIHKDTHTYTYEYDKAFHAQRYTYTYIYMYIHTYIYIYICAEIVRDDFLAGQTGGRLGQSWHLQGRRADTEALVAVLSLILLVLSMEPENLLYRD